MLMKQLRVHPIEFAGHDRVLDWQLRSLERAVPASSRPLTDSSQRGDLGTIERANTPERSGQKLQEGG